MCSCHLFLIASSFRSLLFLSFIVPILAWNVPLISPIFLKRFLVFHSLLLSSISLHCSLKKVFFRLSLLFSGTLYSAGYIFPLSPCLLLLFFPQLFVESPWTSTLPSCISSSLGWFWSLPTVQCFELPSIVLQALSTISNHLNLFVTSTV